VVHGGLLLSRSYMWGKKRRRERPTFICVGNATGRKNDRKGLSGNEEGKFRLLSCVGEKFCAFPCDTIGIRKGGGSRISNTDAKEGGRGRNRWEEEGERALRVFVRKNRKRRGDCGPNKIWGGKERKGLWPKRFVLAREGGLGPKLNLRCVGGDKGRGDGFGFDAKQESAAHSRSEKRSLAQEKGGGGGKSRRRESAGRIFFWGNQRQRRELIGLSGRRIASLHTWKKREKPAGEVYLLERKKGEGEL